MAWYHDRMTNAGNEVKALDNLPIADRIGISTHFLPATHGESIFDAIRMVHEAGFRGFAIVPTLDQAQLGYPRNYPNVGIDLFESTAEDISRLKDALSVFDWVTVHGPHLDWNLSSANRHLRELTARYFDRCLEFAIELGAAAMTYHYGTPTWGYIRSGDTIQDPNLFYAKHLMALSANVPLGYEVGTFDMLKYVCDRVDGWGVNLDLGHAYMAAGSDDGFYRFIDEFGDRLVEIHHNGVNHYWGGYMEHQPPHMNNTIDYQGAYTRLREIDYDGPIICEIQGHDIAQVIEHCIESKEMIIGIWEGTRSLVERYNRA